MQRRPSGPDGGSALPAFLDRAWRGGPSLLLFVICLVGAGFLSVRLGTDRNWDLKNYHLYGPYALLHGRILFDVAPAQLQSFFNPLLHVPHRLLFLAMHDRPKGFAFVMGLPAGAFAFLMLRAAWEHATQVVKPGLQAWAAVAVFGAMGLTGAAVLPGVGLSAFDVVVAVPLALAYLLVLRAVIARSKDEPVGLGWLALAGAVAGLAGGLKLTVLPFAAAIGVMILLLLGFRAAVVAGATMLAGFLLGFAPFAWQLWQAFGNPLFPHFNHVFRSPDWFPVATADERFLPRTTLQAVFYPFWWLKKTSGLVSELQLRDPRFAMAYVAWIALAAMVALRPRAAGNRAALLALGVLALCYAAWAKQFGIYRYLVFPEALAVLVVMLGCLTIRPFGTWPAMGGFALAAVGAIAFTVHPNWGHGRHARQLLAAEPMPVQPGALVVTVDGAPMAYLVTLMPRDARVLGLANNIVQPGWDHGLKRRAAAAIAAQSGPIWSLADAGTTEAERDRVLAAYGLAVDGACVVVRDTLEPGGHRFCPLRKAD